MAKSKGRAKAIKKSTKATAKGFAKQVKGSPRRK